MAENGTPDIDFCFAIRHYSKKDFNACYQFIKQFDKPIYLFPKTTADGYLKKILGVEHDYIVSIDEDAFLYNHPHFLSFLQFFSTSGYTLAGMRDGGACRPRGGHPMIVNPFFMLINRKKAVEYFKPETLAKSTVTSIDHLLTEEASGTLIPGFWQLGNGSIEPYYPFFTNLLENGARFYYIACENWENDPGVIWEGERVKVATTLFNHQKQDFLIHCWFTSYYEYEGQKSRFEVIYDYANSIADQLPLTVLKKTKLAFTNNLKTVE